MDVTAIAAALSTLMGTTIDDPTATLVVQALAGNAGAAAETDPTVILAAATGSARAWLQQQVATWQAAEAQRNLITLGG